MVNKDNGIGADDLMPGNHSNTNAACESIFDKDINMGAVKSQDSLPIGVDFLVCITNAENKLSQTGNPMMQIELTVISGEHADITTRDTFPFAENMYWKLKNLLKAVGHANAEGVVKASELVSDLLNTRVVIRLSEFKTKTGEIRKQIQYKPYNKSEHDPF